LNSIFAQNYTNYKVVIIDDASGDNTAERIQSYLSFYKINQEKCLLKKNKENKKAL
jgi:glycosyltransferase involved in cell wall biosynthesis